MELWLQNGEFLAAPIPNPEPAGGSRRGQKLTVVALLHSRGCDACCQRGLVVHLGHLVPSSSLGSGEGPLNLDGESARSCR